MHEILQLERTALDRWGNGDPEGFLALNTSDVTYFDPYLPRRINGNDEMAAHLRPLTGKIAVTRYEIVDPQVRESGDLVLLTYNLINYRDGAELNRWNCTEVYARLEGAWRIAHSHWSYTKPEVGGESGDF